MIIDAARMAASRLFTPEFRSVLLKSIAMTLLLLVAAWFGMKGVFEWLALPWLDAFLPGLPSWAGWLGVVAAIFAGVGLALGLALCSDATVAEDGWSIPNWVSAALTTASTDRARFLVSTSRLFTSIVRQRR